MKHLIRKGSIVTGIVTVSLSLSSLAGYAADNQARSSHPSDQVMIHQVHSAIVEDESLPYCAHVVRVQCRKGKVTLKGKVKTEGQKDTVVEKAAAIAGEENVVSRIRVTGS